MTSNFFNISTYSRFNLAESESDIHLFVEKYKERIKNQLNREEAGARNPFKCFTTRRLTATNLEWLEDNENKFLRDTANSGYTKQDFLVECGFICSMVYTPDGENVVVGHSSGMIQVEKLSSWLRNRSCVNKLVIPTYLVSECLLKLKDMEAILNDYKKSINHSYGTHKCIHAPWYPMFYKGERKNQNQFSWVKENNDRFIKDSPNKVLYYRWFYTEMGAITALAYSPNGTHIIVGHSSGLIQMRHGSTGVVLCTLRNIQFPPKPVYALEYSKQEERICYAACMDGAVYRIEIPPITAPVDDPPAYCIRVDPALENMSMQFYGTPGISSYSTPFITQRAAPLSIGLTAEDTKLAVGYNDASIKIYDLETQEASSMK